MKIIIVCSAVVTSIMVMASANASVDPADTDPCGDCQFTKCRVEIAACLQDKDCVIIGKCLAKCEGSHEECAPKCMLDPSPATARRIAGVISCTQNKCSKACQ